MIEVTNLRIQSTTHKLISSWEGLKAGLKMVGVTPFVFKILNQKFICTNLLKYCKFKLFAHAPDFNSFWNIMVIFSNNFQFDE